MQTITNVIYTTVFNCIAITENLIGYDSFIDYENLVDYARFIIQKFTNKMIIDLNVEEFTIYVNAAEKFIT